MRVLAPAVPITSFKRPSITRAELRRNPLRMAGYVPDHLPFHPFPDTLEDRPRRPKFFESNPGRLRRGVMQATTVSAPDDRSVFSDTSYPWGTVGRVDSGGAQGSGTMVGPRHLLTASHMIVWNSDGTAGWLTFSTVRARSERRTPYRCTSTIR